MKYWALLTSAVWIATTGQATTSNGLTNFPAIPKAEPFADTVFGTKVEDPYRWMERADRRGDLENWVNASSLHTTTEIAALPGRDALFKQLEAASRTNDVVGGVQGASGTLFYEKLSTDKNIPVLMVREGGKDRLLLDPMAGTDGKNARAISSFAPSPDGKYVAIHLAEGGGARPARSASTTLRPDSPGRTCLHPYGVSSRSAGSTTRQSPTRGWRAPRRAATR